MSDRNTLNRDSTCLDCGRTIPAGTYLDDLIWNRGRRQWAHGRCPPPAPPQSAAISPVGSPHSGPEPHPPARDAVDAPIYTHHRVLKFYRQGMLVGEINEGVSVKGRPLNALEIENVDALVREQAKRNELGELAK